MRLYQQAPHFLSDSQLSLINQAEWLVTGTSTFNQNIPMAQHFDVVL